MIKVFTESGEETEVTHNHKKGNDGKGIRACGPVHFGSEYAKRSIRATNVTDKHNAGQNQRKRNRHATQESQQGKYNTN